MGISPRTGTPEDVARLVSAYKSHLPILQRNLQNDYGDKLLKDWH